MDESTNTEQTKEPVKEDPLEDTPGYRRRPYIPKTREELKTIAMGMLSGSCFSSDNFREQETDYMLPMVFMCIALDGPDQANWYKENEITMIYEWLDKASPQSINGYPIFTSHSCLNRSDHKKVHALIKRLQVAFEEV